MHRVRPPLADLVTAASTGDPVLQQDPMLLSNASFDIEYIEYINTKLLDFLQARVHFSTFEILESFTKDSTLNVGSLF